MAVETDTDTVIVGASAAGLATAACLQRASVPFVLLEERAQVAGAWRTQYDPCICTPARASPAYIDAGRARGRGCAGAERNGGALGSFAVDAWPSRAA